MIKVWFSQKGIAEMYVLNLTEERLKLYITGLDVYIKHIGSQLMQNNSAISLRNLLPQLTAINNELLNLDVLIDETDKKTNVVDLVPKQQIGEQNV